MTEDVRPLIPMVRVPRRRFVQGSILTSGAAAGLALVPGRSRSQPVPDGTAIPDVPGATPAGTPVAGPGLSEAETATMRAAIDRLIPTDELGPGATASGVDAYITQTLRGYDAATLPLYQAGMAGLNAAAGGDGFAAADAATQDDLLSSAEAGELSEVPEGFFALLLEHTRQGMFGDPVYGGNRDFAGWDLVHYPGIKLVWTEPEQDLGADVTPEHRSVAELGGEGTR